MTFKSLALLLLGGLLTASAQAEQTCRTDLDEYTPTSRFAVNGDGTVTDNTTKMMWMRCALGQSWNGKACTGKAASYSWQEANDAVKRLNASGYAGHNDWVLPMVPNLASIVERRCLNPRINQTIFPATAMGPFWTSMQKKDAPDFVYIIDFGHGGAGPLRKESKAHVRLMRGKPWWTPPKMMPAPPNSPNGVDAK